MAHLDTQGHLLYLFEQNQDTYLRGNVPEIDSDITITGNGRDTKWHDVVNPLNVEFAVDQSKQGIDILRLEIENCIVYRDDVVTSHQHFEKYSIFLIQLHTLFALVSSIFGKRERHVGIQKRTETVSRG